MLELRHVWRAVVNFRNQLQNKNRIVRYPDLRGFGILSKYEWKICNRENHPAHHEWKQYMDGRWPILRGANPTWKIPCFFYSRPACRQAINFTRVFNFVLGLNSTWKVIADRIISKTPFQSPNKRQLSWNRISIRYSQSFHLECIRFYQ